MKVTTSWILYDVANSAFILLACSIIPIYFNQIASGELSESQYISIFSIATSLTTAILIFLGPMIGGLSDQKDWKKPVFVFTVLLGVLSCYAMGIPMHWLAFLLLFIIARIAFYLSLVISDGMLNDIATEDELDKVSCRAYAMGYIGSCIPFALCLVLVLFSDLMDKGSSFTFQTAILLSLLITGTWWLLLSLPLFKEYEQKRYRDDYRFNVKVLGEQVKGSVFSFRNTIKNLFSLKFRGLFIIAFFLYIDGVNTIMTLSTSYGVALGLDSAGLLGALLLSQIVAFPATLLFSYLSNKYETQMLLVVCIIRYIAISLFACFMNTIWMFFALAFLVGMFQGSIQALSRSYFARMIPKDRSGEYFGIMDTFCKGATVLGTMTVAIVTYFSNEIRFIAIFLLIQFVVGLVVFNMSVKEEKKSGIPDFDKL